MKKNIPQFELPGAADCFNLAGEFLIQHHTKTRPAGADETLPLFVDRREVETGRARLRADEAIMNGQTW